MSPVLGNVSPAQHTFGVYRRRTRRKVQVDKSSCMRSTSLIFTKKKERKKKLQLLLSANGKRKEERKRPTMDSYVPRAEPSTMTDI
jgi:hypothetical protein